ncbi:glycosyltransferase family 39 protein [Calothrix membranacea FACHB-236]|nr:glycosyltransferase family 39 protein [Calothrix membranacea FACHB-236]
MQNYKVLSAVQLSPFLIIIFLVSLMLRILEITIPLNVDEVLWLSRGTIFFQNLLDSRLAETFLRHHPGVTNMWLNGSGMVLNCWFNQLFPGWLDMNPSPDLKTCLYSIQPYQIPISLYIIPRLLQALITSACMVGIYILAKKLLGRASAVAAIVLLILEPFFLAYQRFLTTDALQADFSVLGLLLFLLYLRGDGTRRLLLVSGLFMGLATASKIPTLFVLPAVIIWIFLIELGVWQSNFQPRGWRRQIIDISLWLLTISTVIFLIWPALWVTPLDTLSKLQTGLSQEADTGKQFFWGQVTDSPGLIFYPLSLVYRLSPALLIGLVACLIILVTPKLRHSCKKTSELVALALVPLCVLVFFSTINRKYDRYFLLAWPELALLAGVGWISIFRWIKHIGKKQLHRLRINRLMRRNTQNIKTALILTVLQILVLLPHYPYYLTYYNPLVGGLHLAQHLFILGQGEGLDQVATWLNQLPNSKNITVSSWYDLALTPYLKGKNFNLRTPNLRQANRVVLYANGLQRQILNPELFAFFRVQQSLYSLQIHGVDYVRVYPGIVPLPEDLKSIQVPLSLSFGNQVHLLGYDLLSSGIKPGDELVAAFYWKVLQPLPSGYKINMSLVDFTGQSSNSSQNSLLNNHIFLNKIAPGTIVRDVHILKTTSSLLSGNYQIALKFFDTNNGHVLEVRNHQGNYQGTQAIVGNVKIVNF